MRNILTIIDNVNFIQLLKAFEKFERFRLNDKTEQERAGTIQAFEYCFELVWKIMRRLLAERGKIANSPREVFRMAALEGFLDDPELWFEFLKKRNLTVHTYNLDEAEQVISICPSFSEELRKFFRVVGVEYEA